jgi:hypothetical protein
MMITTCWIGSDVPRRCASRDDEPINEEPPELPLHPDATSANSNSDANFFKILSLVMV